MASERFWHTAGDGRSHAYTGRGESLCGTWVLIGVGMPKDASEEHGSRYCASCMKATRRQHRHTREDAAWRRKHG